MRWRRCSNACSATTRWCECAPATRSRRSLASGRSYSRPSRAACSATSSTSTSHRFNGTWHILTEIELTPQQRPRAIAILKRNLDRYEDWIVLNLTLHALAQFARDDPELHRELIPILRRHQADTRKSVTKRATKLLAQLQQAP